MSRIYLYYVCNICVHRTEIEIIKKKKKNGTVVVFRNHKLTGFEDKGWKERKRVIIFSRVSKIRLLICSMLLHLFFKLI